MSELFADAPSCVLTAEETEGPYYFDADSIRGDIREDRDGARLRLAIRVRDAAACTPRENAVVDTWHCDALGIYSGFEAASTGGGGGSGGGGPTDDETYLRGAQVTNADGTVEFTTIYPGWYRGRTVHIHAKVHKASCSSFRRRATAISASSPSTSRARSRAASRARRAPPPAGPLLDGLGRLREPPAS